MSGNQDIRFVAGSIGCQEYSPLFEFNVLWDIVQIVWYDYCEG